MLYLTILTSKPQPQRPTLRIFSFVTLVYFVSMRRQLHQAPSSFVATLLLTQHFHDSPLSCFPEIGRVVFRVDSLCRLLWAFPGHKSAQHPPQLVSRVLKVTVHAGVRGVLKWQSVGRVRRAWSDVGRRCRKQ